MGGSAVAGNLAEHRARGEAGAARVVMIENAAHQFARREQAWNDPAGDGLSNLQKYLLGLNPLVPARPYLQPLLSPTNGNFALNVQGLFGRSVALEVSTNLTSWQTLTNLTSTNAVIYFEDLGVTNSGSRFYRAVMP